MRSAWCAHYAHMWKRLLDSGSQSSCLCLGLRHMWGNLSRNSVFRTGSWRLLPWPIIAGDCHPQPDYTFIPPVVWLRRGHCFKGSLLKSYVWLPAGLCHTLSPDSTNWMLLRLLCLIQFYVWVKHQICLSNRLCVDVWSLRYACLTIWECLYPIENVEC